MRFQVTGFRYQAKNKTRSVDVDRIGAHPAIVVPARKRRNRAQKPESRNLIPEA